MYYIHREPTSHLYKGITVIIIDGISEFPPTELNFHEDPLGGSIV